NAVPFLLSEDKRLLVQRIINHFDFGSVGVDFLLTKDGAFVFNEIEDVAGSRILSETSDINLLAKYISFIREEVSHLPRSHAHLMKGAVYYSLLKQRNKRQGARIY